MHFSPARSEAIWFGSHEDCFVGPVIMPLTEGENLPRTSSQGQSVERRFDAFALVASFYLPLFNEVYNYLAR
jgi:hypothetical protein